MAFAAPLWLLGLLALAIPIALHLYGRRPGRTIKVGTLRDIPATPVARAFAPRLEDRLRLVLRCAMVASVVLALAAPLLQARRGSQLVVVTSAAARESDAGRKLVDSLQQAGATVMELGEREDAWSGLLRAAQETDGPLHVIASGTGAELGPVRPALANAVTWHVVPLPVQSGSSAFARNVVVLAPDLPADSRRRLEAAVAAVAAEAAFTARINWKPLDDFASTNALGPDDLAIIVGTISAPSLQTNVLRISRAEVLSSELPFRVGNAWLEREQREAVGQLQVSQSMALPRVVAAAPSRPDASQRAANWFFALAASLLLAERLLAHVPRVRSRSA